VHRISWGAVHVAEHRVLSVIRQLSARRRAPRGDARRAGATCTAQVVHVVVFSMLVTCTDASRAGACAPRPRENHRHGGLGLHTPTDVHHGHAGAVREQRAVILSAAYHAHPERFVRKSPVPPKIPTNSWINPPEEMEAIAQ